MQVLPSHRNQLMCKSISRDTDCFSKTGVSIFVANFHLKMKVEARLILDNANNMMESTLLYKNDQDHKF